MKRLPFKDKSINSLKTPLKRQEENFFETFIIRITNIYYMVDYYVNVCKNK